MVRQLPQSEYQIEHLPGFEHLVFSESSSNHLALPQSVAFATKRGGVLQSAREAWGFRISSNGTLESDKYQSTRTAALGVKIGNKYCIALCDSANSDENILLARAEEGYASHHRTGKWLVAKDDPIITRMLACAQDERRVVPALEGTLTLPTTPDGGASAYGSCPVPQAILGADLPERVAAYLDERGFEDGYVRTLSLGILHDLGVDADHIEVRRVGVGGYGSYNLNNLCADDRCGDCGRARGVREISRGNKG